MMQMNKRNISHSAYQRLFGFVNAPDRMYVLYVKVTHAVLFIDRVYLGHNGWTEFAGTLKDNA